MNARSTNPTRGLGAAATIVLALAPAACVDLPHEVSAPDQALHDHRPGHRGGGGGGGGGADDPVSYTARIIDSGGSFAGNSLALDVDEQRTVVGRARVSWEDFVPGAFRWSEGAGDLQALPGVDASLDSDALAIHAGTIAGWEGPSTWERTVFLHDLNGELRRLDHFEWDECVGGHSSSPVAVAAWGVAGVSGCHARTEDDGSFMMERPVVWLADHDHSPFQLPLRSGDRSVILRDVNDHGIALGQLHRNGVAIVVEWQVSAGQVSGPHQRQAGSLEVARAINNQGDIVGRVGARAEFVTKNGATVPLERLHNRDAAASALDLTDRAAGEVRVVGYSGDRPALWIVDAERLQVTSARYLEIPEGHYKSANAVAINSRGMIAGYSITRSLRGEESRQRATVWLPTDES